MPISQAFTLDASAILKLALKESDSEAFTEWYYVMQEAGCSFASPDLLGYEVGNIVCRQFEPHDYSRTFHALLDGVTLSPADSKQTFRFTPHLTYYDAAYVGHAAAEGRQLVSFDSRMLETARATDLPTWGTEETRWSADERFLGHATAEGLVGERLLKASGFSRADERSYVEVVRGLLEHGNHGAKSARAFDEAAHAFDLYVRARKKRSGRTRQ